MRKAVTQACADGLADWRNSPLMSNEKVKAQLGSSSCSGGNLKVARPLPPPCAHGSARADAATNPPAESPGLAVTVDPNFNGLNA